MVASTFDLFRVGGRPSSAHMMGPMMAAADFAARLDERLNARAEGIETALYGSPSLTGKGHATDRAVILG